MVKGNELSVKSVGVLCRPVVSFPHPSTSCPPVHALSLFLTVCLQVSCMQEGRVRLLHSREQKRSAEVQGYITLLTWYCLLVFTIGLFQSGHLAEYRNAVSIVSYRINDSCWSKIGDMFG